VSGFLFLEEIRMPTETAKKRKLPALSIDSWAVALAFALAVLVRAGLFKHIPW
jgi:hypothetical protein